MNTVKFIYWKEYECPKCGAKMLKRRPENPTQFLYKCDNCEYEEYRDEPYPDN